MMSTSLKVNCRSCNRDNVPARVVTGHLDGHMILTCSRCNSIDVDVAGCEGVMPKMKVEKRNRITIKEELERM